MAKQALLFAVTYFLIRTCAAYYSSKQKVIRDNRLDGDHPEYTQEQSSLSANDTNHVVQSESITGTDDINSAIQFHLANKRISSDESKNDPVIVGVCGGSGSGKTTLTEAIMRALGDDHVAYISHDSYYKDLSHLSFEERCSTNFDHPNSLDSELLCSHLEHLKRGEHVEVPVYDFTTHSRTQETIQVNPRRIIIVDGILIFAESKLLELMDMKIFVDTDDDIRLIRRIRRDTSVRKRTVGSVIDQYMKTVRPMHKLYVEPSKKAADIIVPAEGIRTVALDMCVSRLREIITNGSQ